MNLNDLIGTVAKTRAAAIIQKIESGQTSYEVVIAELKGETP
jgi:hypothetical protein